MSNKDDYNADEWGNIGNSDKFNWSNEKLIKSSSQERVANKKRNKERVAAMSRDERQRMYGHSAEEKARQQQARLANPQFWKSMKAQWQQREESGKADEQRRIMAETKQKMRGAFVTPFGEFEYKCQFDDYIQNRFPDHKVSGDRGLSLLPHLYYYKNTGPAEAEYERVFYTPYGIALNNSRKYTWMSKKIIMQKAKDANDPNATNKYWEDWWSKMTKLDPENYYMREEPKREWLLEIN